MVDLIKKYPTLFWDVKLDTIEQEKHRKYIIERVLENGTMESVHDLFRLYKEHEIIDVIKNSRNLGVKTANFWKIKLNITEPIKCLQTQSQKMQEGHWKY